MLQHLVHLERGIEIAQVIGHLKQAQPDARHLGVSRKASEALTILEIRFVGAQQEFVGFELPQQHPGRFRNRLDGIAAPPQNATFKNALEHVGDEMQIVGMAAQIDAIDPTARPEVRQNPIQISLCRQPVT